jgi:putative transposase
MTIVDDFTKDPIDLVTEHVISGHYVVLILQRTAQFLGLPLPIRTDPGPQFTGKALGQRAYQNGVQLKLIEPESKRRLPLSRTSTVASATIA